MRKLLLIFIFIVFNNINSYSQGTEDFNNSNATSSYLDGSFVGNSSITWTYVHSRNGNGDNNGSGINLPALMLRRSSSDSKITSSTISGGITDFTMKLYKGFTGSGNRQVELFINGVSKGSSTPFNNYNEQNFSVSGINVSGDIVIEIRNITSKQVIIDDITWTAYSNDLIVSSDQTISSDLSYDNVTVNSGQTLTISKTGSLTVLGNLTNNGTVILNSDNDEYGSLIVQGTSSGNINYNRWINSISIGSPTSGDTGWDLVGSPVVGASLTSSNFSENSGNYAIQPYDNSDNTWTTTSSASVSTSIGIGYAMAKQTAGTEAFTGTVETSDKNVNITNNDGSGSGTQWNLIANPYPSYLALNSNARSASSASTDFITQNAVTADVLGSGTNEDAIWYWTGSGYGQYNNSSSAKYIAPGQGFFIASKTGGGTLKFLESMQTSTGSDDFISGDIMEGNRGELFINLSQNGFFRETEIYFIEGTTDGSDPTYDARTFPMNNNTISIFTRLVEGDEGVDLSIQALAYSEMWDKVIPLGVNTLGGEEMTIGISYRTTPADLKIYLEDTEEETMTNLLEGDLVLTPISNLSGVGRFFIHMTTETMSNEEISTSMLNAYKEKDASFITVEGLATQSNETSVSLYNILGSEVLSTTLNNDMGTQTISTIKISAGIYVIKLQSGRDRLIKKLLIQ